MSEWVAANRYLSSAEMQNNAALVYNYLAARGFSLNAIAGILGNMQTESSINPGIWEGLHAGKGGYGLVQWTPYTKYSKWAGRDWQNNGDLQCQRIVYEFTSGIQYYPSSTYPMTAAEFMISTESPQVLGMVFLYNYERPKNLNQPARGTQAAAWYEYLSGETPPEPITPDEPYHRKPKIPIWMLFKFRGGK